MTLPTVPRTNQLDVLEEIRDKVSTENTASTNTSTAVGMPADSVATTDTGTFSVIALLKRALSNWTTLFTRLPVATTPGLVPVEVLGQIGEPKVLAIGAASVNIALTATTRRVSIRSTVEAFYSVGSASQVATATKHHIGEGERLDFAVPANCNIAVIQKTSTGTLYISELV